MSQTMIQVRVEKDLKERVSDIYESVNAPKESPYD